MTGADPVPQVPAGVGQLRGLDMFDAGIDSGRFELVGDVLRVAWLESAEAGASGSGESEGMATSAVQKSEGSAPPRLIFVRVTPGARAVTVRFSGRSAGPRLRWAPRFAPVSPFWPSSA